MDLTAYEKETIINYNEGEPTASVYTCLLYTSDTHLTHRVRDTSSVIK